MSDQDKKKESKPKPTPTPPKPIIDQDKINFEDPMIPYWSESDPKKEI